MATSSEESVPLAVAEALTIDRSLVPSAAQEETDSETHPLVSNINSRPRSKCYSISKTLGKWMLKNLLLILTMISVLVGIIFGLSMREVDIEKGSDQYSLMVTLLSFPGELFLRMLKMLILPLIVLSLTAGLGSLESKVAGSLGWKTVLYYFSTTILAISLGLVLVVTIQPGGRIGVVECDNSTHTSKGLETELSDTILDLIRNMLPDNLFAATFSQDKTVYSYETVTDLYSCMESINANMSTLNDTKSCSAIRNYVTLFNISCSNFTQTVRQVSVEKHDGMNILGIIVFTVAFAIVLSRQPGGRRVVEVIGVLNEAIMKLVSLVMWYSPIGIASIIAGKLAEVDDFGALVAEVGLYVVTVMTGLLVHGCIVLPLLYLVMTRKNPLKVVKAVLQALLTAFGTSSSSATLPVTIQNMENNFGADSRVTRFMLPVGATINMDGTALYEAVAAVFIAQVQGITLSVDRYIVISITATLASVGAAGVPQAGLFTLIIVLVAVGLDPENVALILAVDWLLDRFRTTVNVLGDSFGVGIVQHYSRKQLSREPSSPPTPESTTRESLEDTVGYGSGSPSQENLFQAPPPSLSNRRQWSDGSSGTSPPPSLPNTQWSDGSSGTSPQVYLSETVEHSQPECLSKDETTM